MLDAGGVDGPCRERERHPELLEDRAAATVVVVSLDGVVGHRVQVAEHAEDRRLDPADPVGLLEHHAAAVDAPR